MDGGGEAGRAGEERRGARSRTLPVVETCLGLAGLLTIVSGAALSFRYVPEVPGDGSSSAWLSELHRVSAWVTTVVAVAWVLVLVRQRAVLATVAAVGLLVALVGASLTGPAVAWDQVGLWAVSSSFDAQGVWWVRDADVVRFLLIDGMEVGVADYQTLLIVHCGLLAALAAALFLGSVVAVSRRRRDQADVPAPPPA